MPLSVLFLLFITPGPASAPEGQLIKADFLPCHPGILLGENVNRKSKIIKTWEFVKKLAVWRGGRMRFPQLSAPDPHAQMLSSRDCTPRIHSLFLLQMQQGLSAPPAPDHALHPPLPLCPHFPGPSPTRSLPTGGTGGGVSGSMARSDLESETSSLPWHLVVLARLREGEGAGRFSSCSRSSR